MEKNEKRSVWWTDADAMGLLYYGFLQMIYMRSEQREKVWTSKAATESSEFLHLRSCNKRPRCVCRNHRHRRQKRERTLFLALPRVYFWCCRVLAHNIVTYYNFFAALSRWLLPENFDNAKTHTPKSGFRMVRRLSVYVLRFGLYFIKQFWRRIR